MKIISNLETIPNLSIALGFFDGVHIAHQKVINTAVELAKKNQLQSAVITLKKHPSEGKNPFFSYILNPYDRYNFFEKLGVDFVVELDFQEVKNLTAQDYIENILIKYFSPKFITTGFNHTFGHNKSGNPNILKKFQKKYDYTYYEIPQFLLKNNIVSSSNIRKYLLDGKIENANILLGKNFYVTGTVQKGKQLGRTIGFPTANISYPNGIVKLPKGVYKTMTVIDGVKYDGISNFGTCPTVSNTVIETLETHFLDFDTDLYGKNITIYFEKLIRPEKKFDNITSLTKQIHQDIIDAFGV